MLALIHKNKKNFSKFGAEVPFLRSKRLSGDKVPSNPVIRDALIKLEKIYKKLILLFIYKQQKFLRKLDDKKMFTNIN